MPAAREIPEDWAKDMIAAGLVDEHKRPSKKALQERSGLNPSQVNRALFGDGRSGRVWDRTAEALASALNQPVQVVLDRIGKNVRIKRTITQEQAALLDYFENGMSASAREDLAQAATHWIQRQPS